VRVFDNTGVGADGSTYDSLKGGKYFCDDGGGISASFPSEQTGTGTSGDDLQDGNESMMNPWGTKNVAGWPKPTCGAAVVPIPGGQSLVDFDSLKDFGNATVFAQQVDASIAGVMRD